MGRVRISRREAGRRRRETQRRYGQVKPLASEIMKAACGDFETAVYQMTRRCGYKSPVNALVALSPYKAVYLTTLPIAIRGLSVHTEATRENWVGGKQDKCSRDIVVSVSVDGRLFEVFRATLGHHEGVISDSITAAGIRHRIETECKQDI